MTKFCILKQDKTLNNCFMEDINGKYTLKDIIKTNNWIIKNKGDCINLKIIDFLDEINYYYEIRTYNNIEYIFSKKICLIIKPQQIENNVCCVTFLTNNNNSWLLLFGDEKKYLQNCNGKMCDNETYSDSILRILKEQLCLNFLKLKINKLGFWSLLHSYELLNFEWNVTTKIFYVHIKLNNIIKLWNKKISNLEEILNNNLNNKTKIFNISVNKNKKFKKINNIYFLNSKYLNEISYKYLSEGYIFNGVHRYITHCLLGFDCQKCNISYLNEIDFY